MRTQIKEKNSEKDVDTSVKITIIPSVNFHLWEPCNMRCKFCFATFQDVKNTILPKGHLPKEDALKVVEKLAEAGFEKITFAGGEPSLCPWLIDLIQCAKSHNLTTMIVTNGTRLSEKWLNKNQKYLDWIAVSIDSLNTTSNIMSGRAITGKRAISAEVYTEMIQRVKKYGYRLKINTVVSAVNWKEDMSSFILNANPERWKLFQVLPVRGQNSACVDDFLITDKKFNAFIERHNKVNEVLPVIGETNDLMTASYAMVDPAGRFFDNSKGQHTYSRPILDIGVEIALKEVSIDVHKFRSRDGIYDWN